MSNYIFIVSAPSGAGKSSLLKAFLKTKIGRDHFTLSTSHTTRTPRIGEKHSKEYHFVSIHEFNQMITENKFIEYAKVFQNYYGTSKVEIDSLLVKGKNIILEIDWQGAQKTRMIYGSKVKSIFILPPSINELRKRLEFRNTDSQDDIQYRMNEAEAEMNHADEFDYKLVNDDFNQSIEKLCKYLKENIQG